MQLEFRIIKGPMLEAIKCHHWPHDTMRPSFEVTPLGDVGMD